MKNFSEAALLFRGLAWVNQASQDPRVQTYIVQAMETIHTTLPNDPPSLAIKNVFDWSLLWSLQTGNLERPELAVMKIGNTAPGITSVQQQVRSLWAVHDAESLGHKKVVIRARQRVQYGGVPLRIPVAYTSLFAHLVAVDLNAAATGFLETVSDIQPPEASLAFGRLILELLCVLGSICTNRSIPATKVHLSGIREILCSTETRPAMDTACPGLRSSALMVACQLGQVECRDGDLTGRLSFRASSKA